MTLENETKYSAAQRRGKNVFYLHKLCSVLLLEVMTILN